MTQTYTDDESRGDPIDAYLDHLLVEAVRLGASRIELKRKGSTLHALFNIDGRDCEMPLPPKRAKNEIQLRVCDRLVRCDQGKMGVSSVAIDEFALEAVGLWVEIDHSSKLCGVLICPGG